MRKINSITINLISIFIESAFGQFSCARAHETRACRDYWCFVCPTVFNRQEESLRAKTAGQSLVILVVR